ncbi:hypothetical protein HUT18_15380 [Streptomyces sp. NA04227]|uniref:DUF6480 family protein n=1 Tax=Streptomyces sp. NA04227 TaxID=2742136 RepID=UPI001591AA2D|nr:DUF6480 family protein [Streptomyces sp. NA04227]QKW04964.1 hypothetical protein HUT18_15380 [Streptomyces sp. NA04227]
MDLRNTDPDPDLGTDRGADWDADREADQHADRDTGRGAPRGGEPAAARPGLVPPGETPQGEDSTAGAGPEETYNPTTGWAKGPLSVMAILVLLMVVGFAGMVVALLD